MRLKEFSENFEDELKEPGFAAAYLQYALDDGTETFLIALREVAQANGGMSRLAEATALGRESMYKALSQDGNPKIKTVQSVLKALGLRLVIACDDSVAA
jgi:probable addiction module antidote protein